MVVVFISVTLIRAYVDFSKEPGDWAPSFSAQVVYASATRMATNTIITNASKEIEDSLLG